MVGHFHNRNGDLGLTVRKKKKKKETHTHAHTWTVSFLSSDAAISYVLSINTLTIIILSLYLWINQSSFLPTSLPTYFVVQMIESIAICMLY